MLFFFAKISFAIVIPSVVVNDAAASSFPVSREECAAFVSGAIPVRTWIWSTRPVTLMPAPTRSDRIPVAVNPEKFRCRPDRIYPDNPRRRRRADPDANGNLSAKGSMAG